MQAKHTATRIRIWRGCPAGGRFPPGECFPALGFALLPVSYASQSRQRPQPDPRTLDEYTPRQWSANFIFFFVGTPPSTSHSWIGCFVAGSSRSLVLVPVKSAPAGWTSFLRPLRCSPERALEIRSPACKDLEVLP